jgi:tRNA(adenine34) deaminase
MDMALSLAKEAARRGEVPVGALVVRDGRILGTGFNLREHTQDPTAHAEIIAIRQAAQALSSWRLNGADLYVTLEPCLMCAGAIYQARVARVYFGTKDPKAGAMGSLYEVQQDTRLNHRVVVESGLQADSCGEVLKEFFQARR